MEKRILLIGGTGMLGNCVLQAYGYEKFLPEIFPVKTKMAQVVI